MLEPAAHEGSDGTPPANGRGIPLGILYSQSGHLSVTEMSIQRGALLAVEEVNASGGIAGRPLAPVIEDCASDTTTAAQKVRKLIRDDHVVACVGGYTSAARVAMLPVVRAERGLLVYPTYYEGLEADPNTFYTGAVPNQFLVDYLHWVFEHLGNRLYVIGSDYVYPRTLGALIHAIAQAAGATVIGDRYIPLAATDFAPIIDEIGVLRPEVVISNIVGSDSTPAFYRQFRSAGHTADSLPIAATVTTEIEIQTMGPAYGAGHYMTATYFGSLENAANARYVAGIHARWGENAVTHVAQVSAYNAVWLVALALRRARDLSTDALREALASTTFDGNPEGRPIGFQALHHTTHPSYVGRTRADGQFEVVAEFEPRPPEAFPRALLGSAGRRIAAL
jgi:urea transport system substrate-binding protein